MPPFLMLLLSHAQAAFPGLAKWLGAAAMPEARSLLAQRRAARGEKLPEPDLIEVRLEETINGLTGRGRRPAWLANAIAQLRQRSIDPDAMFRGESLHAWLDDPDLRGQLRVLARHKLSGQAGSEAEASCRASLARKYEELVGDHRSQAQGRIDVILDVLLAGVSADEDRSASATALRVQAGVESVLERIEVLSASAATAPVAAWDQAAAEFLNRAAAEDCDRCLSQILRRRSIPGVDARGEIAALAARVGAGGDLRFAAPSRRCEVLYWAARLHAQEPSVADAAHAYRAALLKLDPTYGTGIIDAWLNATSGDPQAGLRRLRQIDSPDGHANLMSMLRRHEGAQAALDWLDSHGDVAPDFLTGPGWLNAAILVAEAGRWETAAGMTAKATEEHVAEYPDLLFVDGVLSAAFLFPTELRQHALAMAVEVAPLLQEGAEVDRRRRRALISFGRAAAALRELGVSERTRGAEQWSLWLRLTDTTTRARAEAEIAAVMAAGDTAVDMAALACVSGVTFDPQPLEQHLRRAEATGGLDPFELAAKLALHRWRKPKAELVRFLDAHQASLDALLEPGVRVGLLVAALADAEQIDRAETVLITHREILGADFERLSDYVRSRRGEDVLSSLEERFARTGALIDLHAVCNLLHGRDDAERRRRYGLELFARQRTAENARFVSSALARLGRFDALLAFLDGCEDLVKGDTDLAFFKALALFQCAEFARARPLVARLLDTRGNTDDVGLDVNLAIATADWEHLGAVLDREWPRRHERPPEHLLRLAAVCAEADRSRTVELVQLAAAKAPGDVHLLLAAGDLAIRLGRDDVGMPLIDAAARLSTAEGPVRTVRAADAVPVMLEGASRCRDVWTALSEARLPLPVACSMLNTCVTQVLVIQARANERAADWRQRSIIPFRHGGRLYHDLAAVRTIAADFASLVVLADLDLLEMFERRFERVAVPWSTAEMLISEARDCRFHQPSQVADTKRLMALVTAIPPQVHPLAAVSAAPPPWLVREVGEDLAALLEAARVTGGRVVRPLPVFQAGSMLEAEADLREYADLILQPCHLARLMREEGVLDREAADRARAYLAGVDASDSAGPGELGAGPLYLDRLAASRLTTAGLLEHVPRLGRRVEIPMDLARESERLAATEAEEGAALVVLTRLRAWLRDGIGSGKVRVLPLALSAGQEGTQHVPETLSQMARDIGGSDAVLLDDRALGQAAFWSDAGRRTVPVVGIVDLLRDFATRGIVDPTRRWAAHHALRRRMFSGIPLCDEELEHWLGECAPDGRTGKLLRETAEVRAIREYLLRLRSTTFLRQPAETPYLDQLRAAAIVAIRRTWQDAAVPVGTAASRASWLYEHVLPSPPDWRHTVTEASALIAPAEGVARQIAALLPPVSADRARMEAMADWLERTVVEPLAFASGEVIDLVVAEAKVRIDRWSEQRDAPTVAAIADLLLHLLPGTIRERLLGDRAYLERRGIELETWLTVAGSPKVRRSDVVPAVARAFATGQPQELRGHDGETVRIEASASGARLIFAGAEGQEEGVEPDVLSLLAPDVGTRLDALESVAESLGPTGPDRVEWSAVLREGPLDETGLARFLSEMHGAAPMHVAAVEQTLGRRELELDQLIPADMAYHEALCGPRPGTADPEAYIGGALRRHRQALVDREPHAGLELCLAMCLRADLSCAPLWRGTRDELWATLQGIDTHADPFTALGALDLALHHAAEDHRFATLAAELVEHLCRPTFDRGDGTDVYAFLPALVLCIDDALRCHVQGMREQPVWWRRFCAWTHAAVVCRALRTVRFDPVRLAEWCRGHESREGRLARLLELRQTPGWQPLEPTGPQVRAEILGRLRLLRSGFAEYGVQFPGSENIEALARTLEGEGALGWHLLPGPLEGSQRPRVSLRDFPKAFRRRTGREMASLPPDLASPAWARLAWLGRFVRLSDALGRRCADLVARADLGGDAEHRESTIGNLAHLCFTALVQEWPVLAEAVLAKCARETGPGTTRREALALLTVGLMAISALPEADAMERLGRFLVELCARLPPGPVLQAVHEEIGLLKGLQSASDWQLSQAKALSA